MPASLTSDTIISEPLSNQSKVFLSTLESARDLLARRLIQESHEISEHDLNYAILSSLLQVLFLKTGQECGYAEPETLVLLSGSEDISRRMARACSEAGLIPDILFEKLTDSSSPTPAVPDDPLREVIRCLDSAKLPAPISTIDLEHLAAILEHFLGTRIRVEEGYRVKRAAKSAVLYTGSVNVPPQAVVEYLVKETIADVIKEYEAGRRTGIRILDPACGAGIFLLTAFRFLAHRKTGHSDRSENKREILQSLVCLSVYGVDIDPESVTAARFVLLLSFIEECMLSGSGYVSSECLREICGCLKGTIRCGNALIARDYFSGSQEHPFNAEERNKVNPFSWQEAFPQIFNDGGFNAVIGAPPPYRPFTVKSRDEYFQTHYEVYAKGAGLYGYFIEKGLQILRPEGSLAVRIPDSFLRTNHARPLRKLLLTKQIEEIVDFGDLPVFKSATTYPCIIRVSNNKPVKEFCVSKVATLDFPSLDGYVKEHRHPMDQHTLTDGGWTLGDKRTENLLKKLQTAGMPLEEYVMGGIYYGLKTGLNKAYVIDEGTKNKLIEEDPKSAQVIKPFLVGRDIKRYQPLQKEKYLIYLPWHFPLHTDPTINGVSKQAENEFKKNYPAIYNHILHFKSELQLRNQAEANIHYEWYAIQRFGSNCFQIFEKPKIVYAELATKGQFTLDEDTFYPDTTTFSIGSESKYLLGLLNSKLITFIFSKLSSEIRGGFFRWKKQYMEKLPIYTIDFDNPDDKARHDRMVTLVTEMLELHKHLSQAKTDQEKRLITQEIESTDRQIDSLVYGLYGLTADEIAVVEESIQK